MKLIVLVILTLAFLALAQEPQQIVYEEEIIEQAESISIPTPVEQPEPAPTFVHTPQRKPFKFDLETLKLYKYQLLVISAIFLYLLMYVRGKQANVDLMQKFYRKVGNFLQANFAHIGFSKTSGEAPFNGQSASQSTYYASGRDNVESIQMRFSTKKRQDLIYMLLDIFMPDKDTVTIDLPIKSDIPLVFAVAQRKRVKELTQKHQDIRMMTRQFNVGNLSQGYEVLGEAADTVDSIVDNYVVKKLNQLSGLIMSIHYTDLQIFSSSTGHLRIVFNLAHKKPQQFLPGLQLALYLADKIVGLKISANSKAKALKSRQAYNQSKEKQDLQKHKEQLQKKREEKLRQQQAWIRSLPPEKQKKEEQKRKKKEFNRMMKGKTMKV